MALVDTQPFHARLANAVGNLECCDAGKISSQPAHQQFDLHAGDLRHVVVLLFHVWWQLRNSVPDISGVAAGRRDLALNGEFSLQVFFHLAHQRHVLAQQMPIFLTHQLLDAAQIVSQVIQHAGQQLPILLLPVELVEHLVRIIDRSHRLVGAGVGHPRPCVSSVGDHNTKFERAKSRACGGVGLILIANELVNRDTFRPTGRRVRSTLNITGKEFDSGQQTSNSPHMSIAITLDAIADAVHGHHAILEFAQRFEDAFQLESFALDIRPEMLGNDAIGAEDKNQTLFCRRSDRVSPGEAGQIASEVGSRSADTCLAEEFTSIGHVCHLCLLRVSLWIQSEPRLT